MLLCFERRNETNGRTDSSRAEPVSQRVPYSGSHKEDNEEYKSNFLRAFFASFERHVKRKAKKRDGLCLMKDVQFEQTRKALRSKQRDLKRRVTGFHSVFQILTFRRTILRYFQDVLFYSN